MITSEQLEREAEETRARIADTLEELRARVSPGHLVDQLVDYARNGSGGMFLDNLRRQVVSNPLPVALMGAGLGWLMMASRSPTRADWPVARGAHASEIKDTVRGAASAVGATATSAGSAVSEAASSAYAGAAHGARRSAHAISGSASALQRGAAGATQGIERLFREQPLVLAGLGIALGALLGAALPSTEMENELTGEASESEKREQAPGARGDESQLQRAGLKDPPDAPAAAPPQASSGQHRDSEPTRVPAERSDVASSNERAIEPGRST
jgi:hypothetical protein